MNKRNSFVSRFVRGLSLAAVVTLGIASASNASATCTGGPTLAGRYGIAVHGGTAVQVLPEKTLNGTLTFNGACGITGTVSIGENNTSNDFASVTGSYNTSSDNTIAVSLNIPGESSPETYQVGYSPILGEAIGVETDSSAVAYIDLKAQLPGSKASATYNNASLKGTWAASCTGYTGGDSDLNYFSFDGSTTNYGVFGNFSGVDYTNGGGSFATQNYKGEYAVFADGSFGGSLAVNGSIALGIFGSIDNNGNEIQYSYLLPSNRVFDFCTAKRVK